MPPTNLSSIIVENTLINSIFLEREVKVDLFPPKDFNGSSNTSLLLINDGQNMNELDLENILESLYAENLIKPVLIAAIHAGSLRKMEYGIANQPDYLGRGAKAKAYTQFILEELLPFINERYQHFDFAEKAFAGFSLGGLMALDLVWNHPDEFTRAGVFSGSLWWRSVDDSNENYNDDQHRIMHQQVKSGTFHSGLKFFFTTGSLDETHDRNNNGVIDSIDDTLALINDLEALGYKNENDIRYINYEDGKHDMATWARAMPEFLKWGWSKNS